MADYKVNLGNQLGTFIASIDQFVGLECTLVANAVHWLHVRVPATFDHELLQEDSQITVTRNDKPLGDTVFLIQSIRRVITVQGEKFIDIGAAGALKVLEYPIVAYNAGTSQAEKAAAAADDLIKEIVAENLGGSATDTDRDMSAYLTIEPDKSDGASIAKSFSRRNVLLVCQELAAASATAGTKLYFDVIKNYAGNLELRTFTGQRGTDNSTNVIIGPDRQNLSSISIERNYSDLVNYAYAGGQGQEADRNIQTAQSIPRIRNSIWGRVKEGWRDARHVTIDSSVQAEANRLIRDKRERIIIDGTFIDTTGIAYDVDFKWGDLVSVQFDPTSETYTALINPVSFDVAAGRETITVQFRAEL